MTAGYHLSPWVTVWVTVGYRPVYQIYQIYQNRTFRYTKFIGPVCRLIRLIRRPSFAVGRQATGDYKLPHRPCGFRRFEGRLCPLVRDRRQYVTEYGCLRIRPRTTTPTPVSCRRLTSHRRYYLHPRYFSHNAPTTHLPAWASDEYCVRPIPPDFPKPRYGI